MDLTTAVTAVAAAAAGLTLYLYRLNQIMFAVPAEALKLSPNRWTDEELRETYERLCKRPVDYEKVIPPKLGRRYIVVGGSGNVGGNIVLQLLQRGESAEAIRIVDFSAPTRADLQGVGFAQADISNAASTTAALTKPWPTPATAALPLTVLHVAALIRSAERTPATWHRTEPVNVTGTRNVLAATQAAAATSASAAPAVFVFTSSVSAAVRPVPFLTVPAWAPHPPNAFQLLDERDFDAPLRSPKEFFANYAYAKALTERFVCEADKTPIPSSSSSSSSSSSKASSGRQQQQQQQQPLLRTGVIRPGGGIYGLPRDLMLADLLQRGVTNTNFAPNSITNVVSARNVALAQLQLEAALLLDTAAGGAGQVGGRPYMVTDPGPAPAFKDLHRAVQLLSKTPTKVTILPPLLLYLVASGVEAWVELLVRLPVLKKLGLKEPSGDLANLQPSVFTMTSSLITVDDRARKSVGKGGFGYHGGATTLEGVCELIRDWNQSQDGQ